MAIAWSGTQLYVAGFNSSASTINTAITQITNPNAGPRTERRADIRKFVRHALDGSEPRLHRIGPHGRQARRGMGQRRSLAQCHPGLRYVEATLCLWNLSASGTTTTNVGTSRGMAGIGVDPGYQGNPSQGGGGFAWTTQGSGRRAENDPTTGIPSLRAEWKHNAGQSKFLSAA